MPLAELDLAALRRWVITARADLDAYAEALNRLNVFPVPDGDTGSNLQMTMRDAVDALDEEGPDDIGAAAAAMARATLVSARGNSGVILSQLAKGVAEVVAEAGRQPLGPGQLAAILTRAAELAQGGVSAPAPGTILTVAAAAASAANAAEERGCDLTGVTDAAAAGATDALLRTRTENDVLRRAGVVDAGGAGYLLVLEALQRVIHGQGGLALTDGAVPEWLRVSSAQAPDAGCGAEGAGGPAYEVMYLLDEATPEGVAVLRRTLHSLGDSLVVAGGPDRYTVHVHVDDVAAALNAGAAAGRPHRFRVTRFADEVAADVAPVRPDVAVLALVSGVGMAQHVRASGGVTPVRDWHDEHALRRVLGRQTLMLCTSPQAREAAEALAGECELEIVGDNAADVVAASVVVDPGDEFRRICRDAREAADGVLSVRVVGDPGQDALMHELVDLLAESTAELLTLVAGDALPDDRLAQLVEAARADHSYLGICQITGDGPDTLLTIGVE
ncbi:DAK2 domain-containing protein [Flexivirga caeni]|uniref:DAK2 domain-containing protein n=2 Tax=Flexivirga caeni TaxID=2294115 RepID=A0A3M9MCJ6_9MICO|nr:DAK2 domain-containing protein [Flexivirga caeni]